MVNTAHFDIFVFEGTTCYSPGKLTRSYAPLMPVISNSKGLPDKLENTTSFIYAILTHNS